jgi:zinc transport system ATP-binding protein
MREVIEVRDLTFSYDGKTFAVEGVSFSVEEGEFLGVVGPNGSGKTTLLKLLLGLLKPHRGLVRLRGRAGYVPQKVQTKTGFPGTVGEVLASANTPEEVLERLHLKRLAGRRFRDLSGGEQRLVLFGLALSGNPEVLLLDEPTAGLDTHARRHIAEILEDLKGTRTVVMVSHDIGLVLRLATRILCLNRRVHYLGTPEEAPGFIEELFGIGTEV